MTSANWEVEYQELIRRSYSTQDPDEKVRLLEAAARLADHHDDVDRGYNSRTQLISAASFGGQPDKALVAFAWCRAQTKKNPTRFHESRLLWSNKWVIGALPNHLGVTREQILLAQEDFAEALLRDGGAGKRAVAKLRLITSLSMGNLDDARGHYQTWVDTPRDYYSDCTACDADTEVDANLVLGRYAEAIERAAPILSGQLSCAEVPHITYSLTTMSFFHLGRLDEAKRSFLRGYRLTKGNRNYLSSMARYLAFLGFTDNHGPALTVLERHVHWAFEARAPLDAMAFYISASFVLSRICASGEAKVALRLPRSFALFREDGLYDTGELAQWFEGQAATLAGRFDARNGNQHYASQVARAKGFPALVVRYPITRGLG